MSADKQLPKSQAKATRTGTATRQARRDRIVNEEAEQEIREALAPSLDTKYLRKDEN